MSVPARVEVIGVPMDLGADRRGVDMGPSAIRYARLRERLRELGVATLVDRGDLAVPHVDGALALAVADAGSAKYLGIILAVCDELAAIVAGALAQGALPLVLGGDHSIAIGTLAGIARARGGPPGLIWIDAHADINSEQTSPSGNVHGMPISFALEAGSIVPERTVLVGLRDVDACERTRIAALGIRAFSMSEIDRLGMEGVIEEAIALAGEGDASVHVSFDMDALDPRQAPGVGTPVRGGLTYREAHLALERIAAAGILGSLEVVEVNPILDERNRTAELAVELILSALGKTIL
ncbi:MAG: arginase [Vulcanimicrobiaceae bacterium]